MRLADLAKGMVAALALAIGFPPPALAAEPGNSSVAVTPADAKAVCEEILAISAEDLRGFLEVLREAEAEDLEARSCAALFRCLLAARAAEEESQPAAEPPPAGSWREEFARICGLTDGAASLPREELELLLRQSDALRQRIEGLGTPEVKVYLFRLEKCRAFFEYSLELEEARRGEDGAGGG